MATTIEVTYSQEDYLEAIYFLENEQGAARVTDIAWKLKLSKSAVSTTLHLLRQRGFVNYAPYKLITLTKTGRKAARKVARRHMALKRFLKEILLLDDQLADETACKMEHGISKQVITRISKFIEFVERCPRSGSKWLEGFGFYCQEGDESLCAHCSSAADADTQCKIDRTSPSNQLKGKP